MGFLNFIKTLFSGSDSSTSTPSTSTASKPLVQQELAKGSKYSVGDRVKIIYTGGSYWFDDTGHWCDVARTFGKTGTVIKAESKSIYVRWDAQEWIECHSKKLVKLDTFVASAKSDWIATENDSSVSDTSKIAHLYRKPHTQNILTKNPELEFDTSQHDSSEMEELCNSEDLSYEISMMSVEYVMGMTTGQGEDLEAFFTEKFHDYLRGEIDDVILRDDLDDYLSKIKEEGSTVPKAEWMILNTKQRILLLLDRKSNPSE